MGVRPGRMLRKLSSGVSLCWKMYLLLKRTFAQLTMDGIPPILEIVKTVDQPLDELDYASVCR